jgi:hypothetical protein
MVKRMETMNVSVLSILLWTVFCYFMGVFVFWIGLKMEAIEKAKKNTRDKIDRVLDLLEQELKK